MQPGNHKAFRKKQNKTKEWQVDGNHDVEVTNRSEDWTEKNCQQDEGRVPVVLIIDGIHTQEHEDDRLRAAAQHFHGVLDGCVRFRRYVAFNIVLHGDATKCDSALSHYYYKNDGITTMEEDLTTVEMNVYSR